MSLNKPQLIAAWSILIALAACNQPQKPVQQQAQTKPKVADTNLLTSQVTGDSAKFTSEEIGKILQERSTVSTTNHRTSISQSLQLDLALPASKIATLSSGEFVGITADSPD